MPINNVSNSSTAAAEKGPGGGGRTTFRPPWVKEGPQPIPMPKAPWSKRQSLTTPGTTTDATAKDTAQPAPAKDAKLQSKEIKVPVVSALKKTPAAQLQSSIAPKPKTSVVNEDVEGVKNGLKNLLRKTESISVDDAKSDATKMSIDARMAAKKAQEEALAPGTAEKPGKFVRPVLKKVARVEPAPLVPPKTITAPPPVKPATVVKAAPKKPESDDEEETDSEEEYETETETETESESEEEEVVVKKAPAATTPIAAKPTKSALKSTVAKPSTSTPSKPVTPAPKSNVSSTPAPPPPPPPPKSIGAPPPPPPPPGLIPPPDFERKPISSKQLEYLEKLKNRPRKRPDWSDMMKEVESGRKLRHVQCNDRSSPILTSKSITNIKGQFIYETEKANVHNALLKQIQFGIKLKSTRCNDRSKPVLDGLRKFRRQMTIEEKIIKSESRAQLDVAPDEESEDEMDDIDKLRDDLQSSKQMLALELRSKEAQERENKRLLSKIQQLEAELEREKSKKPTDGGEKTDTTAKTASDPANDVLVKSLKSEAEEAQKTAKMLEKKYQEAAEQLDNSKGEIEEQRRTIANLEKKLANQKALTSSEHSGFNFSRDSSESPEPDRFNCNYMWQESSVQSNGSRRQSEAQKEKESSPEPELSEEEGDEEESEEKKAERLARRLTREVKMMSTRLGRLKDKESAAKKERENLREAMKKNQGLLKVELKKFKKLQREVDKMAAMMKEDDDADNEDEEPKEEPEDEESAEEESEEESESEESEDETDSDESESEPEDSTDEQKKANYEPRIKRHDGRLSALKKGNYLVQANVDRLQDEINKMREKSVSLQADLDSVLSELG